MDLSLVPLGDLADEIVKRGACGIVLVVDVTKKEQYVNWVGDYHMALGLCVDIQNTIITDTRKHNE